METTALATRTDNEVEIFLANWEKRKELASTLLKSGFLPQAFKTPEQVIAVMLKGQELGIPAMEALNGINVIQGKPTTSPQLMLALVNRSRELDDLKIDANTKDKCVYVTVKRRGRSPHTTRFGETEARSLGLLAKDNYKKQAFIMYQWRSLAMNLRITFPDIIAGMYTAEEMGGEVMVSDDGSQMLISDADVVHPEDPSDAIVDGVNTKTGEIMDDPPQSPTSNGGMKEFDPSKARLEFGRYDGMFWSEIPNEYLGWLSKNATVTEIKAKADATIRWHELQQINQAQMGDAFEGIFEEPKPAQSEQHTYDALCQSLDIAIASKSTDALVKWTATNKTLVDSLSDDHRKSLREKFTAGRQALNGTKGAK